MTSLRLILGDQLDINISSLRGINKTKDIILMCELTEEATYVKHHKKKIVLIFSAMRHFAKHLKQKNYCVDYIKLDDKNNTGNFFAEVTRACQRHKISDIVITHPGEYRLLKSMKNWQRKLNLPVEIREDDRFLCSISEFDQWAISRKELRMEFFYREMRRKHNILMHNDKPIGGKWNFDTENRQPPSAKLKIPSPYRATIDSITKSVIQLVNHTFADHFGDLEPFHFAVTRAQAKRALQHFIDNCLKNFGTYQDAMLYDQPWMFHSHLSFYLNIGLLNPRECIAAALQAYRDKTAPINAVEGFVRQILGWREYVRGIYWHAMPNYANKNFFLAKRKLPNFFWDADTDMNCLKQCIKDTKQHAYAHHIQRLMVIGNFALLTGIHPKYVNEWYLIVYADAYQWVELPNVTGMILFADGGYLASKPYAAGGAYINKMSNYCANCRYQVNTKNGEQACPFNYLYWNFLLQHKSKLQNNQRMRMVYHTLKKMSSKKIDLIKQDAKRFLDLIKG